MGPPDLWLGAVGDGDGEGFGTSASRVELGVRRDPPALLMIAAPDSLPPADLAAGGREPCTLGSGRLQMLSGAGDGGLEEGD